ncbi:hypothetical protein ACH3XW_34400 [Acanthocheilonema viteae]
MLLLHVLNQRLEQYKIDEIQNFIEQKIRKINNVIREQEITLRPISSIVLKPDQMKSDPDELTRKYGFNPLNTYCIIYRCLVD